MKIIIIILVCASGAVLADGVDFNTSSPYTHSNNPYTSSNNPYTSDNNRYSNDNNPYNVFRCGRLPYRAVPQPRRSRATG